MMSLQDLNQYGEEMERLLRLKTFPIAVKLLKEEADIPEGAVMPVRDLGYRLLLCQAFAMSRRNGMLIAMLKEDNYCFVPLISYGLAEPPQPFLDGLNRFPNDVATLEAGRNHARDLPRFDVGQYIGMVSAPLIKASFQPDLVIIYCDPAQLTVLLSGSEYKNGHHLACNLSCHALCAYAVVPVMQTGEYQVAMPCRGDRLKAMARDDELVFAVPTEKLEDFMVGLRNFANTGRGMPGTYDMRREPDMPESYMKIAKMMGMFPDK